MPRFRLLQGEAIDALRRLPEDHFHCVVTSPPYLWVRDYKVDGQLGMEATPEEYVERLVAIFQQVHRVLRADGTLWLNLGDCYARAGGEKGGGNRLLLHMEGTQKRATRVPPGLKEKDLVGVPWRVALALQAYGWYLRAENIWLKTNVQPESPSDRPSREHEHVFLLSKSKSYFYDQDAIREPHSGPPKKAGEQAMRGHAHIRPRGNLETRDRYYNPLGRNRRTVWEIATRPYEDAHFATFPPELPELCIKAGSSDGGCCEACGTPRERVTTREFVPQDDVSPEAGVRVGMDESSGWEGTPRGVTLVHHVGWEWACGCAKGPVPCRVLDPFIGSGTTAMVALRLGRDATGIDLKPDYLEMARKRVKEDGPLLNMEDADVG